MAVGELRLAKTYVAKTYVAVGGLSLAKTYVAIGELSLAKTFVAVGALVGRFSDQTLRYAVVTAKQSQPKSYFAHCS